MYIGNMVVFVSIVFVALVISIFMTVLVLMLVYMLISTLVSLFVQNIGTSVSGERAFFGFPCRFSDQVGSLRDLDSG